MKYVAAICLLLAATLVRAEDKQPVARSAYGSSGSSSYSAPAQSYSAPAPAPSYSAPAPAPSYSAPAPAPSYSAPAPAPAYSAPASIPAPPCPKNYLISCQPSLTTAPCAQSAGYGGSGAYSQNYPVYTLPYSVPQYINAVRSVSGVNNYQAY